MASDMDAKQSSAPGAGRAPHVTGPSPGKQTRVEQIDAGPAQQGAKGARGEVAHEAEDREAGSLGSFGIAECIGLGSKTYTDGTMEVTVSASATANLTLKPSVKVDPSNFQAKSHIRNIVDAAVTVNFDDHGKSIDMQMFSIKQGHLKMSEGVSAKGGKEADAFLTLSCVIPAGGHKAGLPGRHGYVEIDGEVSFDLSYSIKLKGPPPAKPIKIPEVAPEWQAELSKVAHDAAEALKKAAPGLLAGAGAAIGTCIASGMCEVLLAL